MVDSLRNRPNADWRRIYLVETVPRHRYCLSRKGAAKAELDLVTQVCCLMLNRLIKLLFLYYLGGKHWWRPYVEGGCYQCQALQD